MVRVLYSPFFFSQECDVGLCSMKYCQRIVCFCTVKETKRSFWHQYKLSQFGHWAPWKLQHLLPCSCCPLFGIVMGEGRSSCPGSREAALLGQKWEKSRVLFIASLNTATAIKFSLNVRIIFRFETSLRIISFNFILTLPNPSLTHVSLLKLSRWYILLYYSLSLKIARYLQKIINSAFTQRNKSSIFYNWNDPASDRMWGNGLKLH